MSNTNTPVIPKVLVPIMGHGKPAKDDGIIYQLVDPTGLAWHAKKALDDSEEEGFAYEVYVESNDARDGSVQDLEVYVARFTTHASWGLRADMTTGDDKFRLYLEFVRDAE